MPRGGGFGSVGIFTTRFDGDGGAGAFGFSAVRVLTSAAGGSGGRGAARATPRRRRMVMRRTVAMRLSAESEARAMRRTPRLRAVGSYVMYRMSGGARGESMRTTTASVGVFDVVAAGGGAACSAAAESGAPSQRKRRSPVRNSRGSASSCIVSVSEPPRRRRATALRTASGTHSESCASPRMRSSTSSARRARAPS